MSCDNIVLKNLKIDAEFFPYMDPFKKNLGKIPQNGI